MAASCRSLAFLGRTEERESFDARILGSGRFVEDLWREEELKDRLPPQLNLPELVQRVARVMHVSKVCVLRRGKNPDATTARQVICYVATRRLGTKGGVVGEYLSMGQSGVSRCASLGRAVWEANVELQEAVLGDGE